MASKGKPLKHPKRGQVIFGKHLWPIIDFINALLNGEIVKGQSYELIVSDRKIIWKVKEASGSGGSSSYRGEYEPSGATTFGSGPFLFGDMVRVSPTNVNATTATPAGSIIPGVYVCIAEGATETDFPNHPLSPGGETAFWQLIATYPSVADRCDTDGSTVHVFSDEQDSNA